MSNIVGRNRDWDRIHGLPIYVAHSLSYPEIQETQVQEAQAKHSLGSLVNVIFSEPISLPPTIIHLGDTVLLGERYYEVKGLRRFERERERVWKFPALAITDMEMIRLLDERKNPCLILNMQQVEIEVLDGIVPSEIIENFPPDPDGRITGFILSLGDRK